MRAEKCSSCIHPGCECLDYCEAADPYSKTPTVECQRCGRGACEDERCEEFQEYRALLEEGHPHAQAAVLSGWKGAEEI